MPDQTTAEPAPSPIRLTLAVIRSQVTAALADWDGQGFDDPADAVMAAVTPGLESILGALQAGAAGISGPGAGETVSGSAMDLLESALALIDNAAGGLGIVTEPEWHEAAGKWRDGYQALARGRQGGPLSELPEWEQEMLLREHEKASRPAPPLPPGIFGKVEFPGMRSHTGWRTDGMIGGQPCIMISDRAGVVLGEYILGPACRFVRLPVPATSAEPVPQRAQLTAGRSSYADDDYDADDDAESHVPACHDPDCDGECIDTRPF